MTLWSKSPTALPHWHCNLWCSHNSSIFLRLRGLHGESQDPCAVVLAGAGCTVGLLGPFFMDILLNFDAIRSAPALLASPVTHCPCFWEIPTLAHCSHACRLHWRLDRRPERWCLGWGMSFCVLVLAQVSGAASCGSGRGGGVLRHGRLPDRLPLPAHAPGWLPGRHLPRCLSKIL